MLRKIIGDPEHRVIYRLGARHLTTGVFDTTLGVWDINGRHVADGGFWGLRYIYDTVFLDMEYHLISAWPLQCLGRVPGSIPLHAHSDELEEYLHAFDRNLYSLPNSH